jgi:hypothetical protein
MARLSFRDLAGVIEASIPIRSKRRKILVFLSVIGINFRVIRIQ